jgi:hypothetical protein
MALTQALTRLRSSGNNSDELSERRRIQMGFRGSRVQIPPSRFCPRNCGGKSFRRAFANAARCARGFWSNPIRAHPVVECFRQGNLLSCHMVRGGCKNGAECPRRSS